MNAPRDWSLQIARHRLTGLLLDTNLFLLYAMGLHDIASIARFKRTRAYAAEDFRLVERIASLFRRFVTTPHILAEVSNLAINRNAHGQPYFRTLVGVLRAAHEIHVAKDTALKCEAFSRFGLTDSAIIELACRERYLVLTDDLPLASYLQRRGRFAVNLNHLRSSDWLGGN